MCGFIGISGTPEASRRVAEALLVLQHRGQDAAGIAAYDGSQFHIERGSGLVREIFSSEMVACMPGSVAIGHTRYPTVGGGTAADAQPLYTNTPHGIAMAHNGNVTNFPTLKEAAPAQAVTARRLETTCDVEAHPQRLRRGAPCDRQGATRPPGPSRSAYIAMERSLRAASVAPTAASPSSVGHLGMIAFRDPYGIKPAILGTRVTRTDGSALVVRYASESAAHSHVLGYRARTRPSSPGKSSIFDGAGGHGRAAHILKPLSRRPLTVRACSSSSTSRGPTA